MREPCSLPCLLYPALEEGVQALVVDLDDLPADAGKVPLRLAHGPADGLHPDLVVLVNQLGGPVSRAEGGYLPPVLDQLDAGALPHRGSGLLGLDLDLLDDDAFRLRRAFKGVGT